VRGEFAGVDGKVTKISIPDRGVNIEGVKKEKLKGEKFDVYVHTTNIILTGLDSGDKWRINKLEGKKATAARADNKPKTETPKVKEVEKDTKKATKTKTKKGDNEE
jgi:large subunit ribosomal protein L24